MILCQTSFRRPWLWQSICWTLLFLLHLLQPWRARRRKAK